MNNHHLKAGIDAGSTTVKLVVTGNNGDIVYKGYRRHNSLIRETLVSLLHEAVSILGDMKIRPNMTGSAGMGLSETFNIPFMQEVVASASYCEKYYPGTSVLLDLGGEDSKMIFFHSRRGPDIRMNGNCAGGTGSFIDQMASLLGVSIEEMDELAQKSTTVYPIASRCGVFAKTDVQNLISRRIPLTDIAASVFHAVALQSVTSLSRGKTAKPPYLLTGGPMTFIKSLPAVFAEVLKQEQSDMTVPPNAQFIPAIGAALNAGGNVCMKLSQLAELLVRPHNLSDKENSSLTPLFAESGEFEEWKRRNYTSSFKKYGFEKGKAVNAFLGIDSGSSTTKITVVTEKDELLFDFYSNNNGSPLNTVVRGLSEFHSLIREKGADVSIRGSAVTGYGEELLKAALDVDHGIVETLAHYRAAISMDEKVSFVLDIGGQDMKAIFVEEDRISKIEINEACSSGCGSFIEGFATALGYNVSDFAGLACYSSEPSELGTRCTVFMNSRVKQAFREGASPGDISAGLAYSVIRNCLFKVLKLSRMDDLGPNIVAQGGAFRNPAILRALQQLTGKKVTCPAQPELMGSFGAALYARERYMKDGTGKVFSLPDTGIDLEAEKRISCKGCTNHCVVTQFLFRNGNRYFSGNKCEKIFHNKGTSGETGFNYYEYKYRTLFGSQDGAGETSQGRRKPLPDSVKTERRVDEGAQKALSIGVPRVLNMYSNFPFWKSLLEGCGFRVVLSGHSTYDMYRKGAVTVMSDNICFPAKMAHGHVVSLAERKVDRIFFPVVVYEEEQFGSADNSFNCPVVSGYAEVLKSSVNPYLNHAIPLDAPVVSFRDIPLLRKACREYLRSLGVKGSMFATAFERALRESRKVNEKLLTAGREALFSAMKKGRMIVVLAGRPYHADPYIQHKISGIFSSMDVDIISEEHLADPADPVFSAGYGVCQWAYTNRIISAAAAVAEMPSNAHFVQLNSFGCGPDSFVTEKISEILRKKGKNYTLLRIDDITSPGSLRLRIRSLVESIRLQGRQSKAVAGDNLKNKPFTVNDRDRTILAPWFSDFYSPFIPPLAKVAGYRFVNLPPSDHVSADIGLTYANNEICYPATLVVGDIVKALKSGKYDRNRIAVGITQTGGQCRATSYINLIKRAIKEAGFAEVPVVSISGSDDALNQQPGFEIDWKKLARITFASLLYADSLSSMYYSTVSREKEKGAARQLVNSFIDSAIPLIESENHKGLLVLQKEAVNAFNSLPVDTSPLPKIGIVGEIYVKYNSYGHYDLVRWLTENGIEVVVPPLMDFMIQGFVNRKVNIKKNLIYGRYFDISAEFTEWLANRMIKSSEKVMRNYRFYRPLYSIRDEAEKASRIVDLANQFGEGWLIPAEISGFAMEEINHVVCMQPFGCIANHIIAKGVEKRIRDLYPSMNLLYLDFDAGTTRVNVMNRLHFLIRSAKSQHTSVNSEDEK